MDLRSDLIDTPNPQDVTGIDTLSVSPAIAGIHGTRAAAVALHPRFRGDGLLDKDLHSRSSDPACQSRRLTPRWILPLVVFGKVPGRNRAIS